MFGIDIKCKQCFEKQSYNIFLVLIEPHSDNMLNFFINQKHIKYKREQIRGTIIVYRQIRRWALLLYTYNHTNKVNN